MLGLLYLWLTARRNIWCWPVGLAMVSLYIVVFYDARLYSDMGLQGVYIVLQLYGWYFWLRGGQDDDGPEVSRLPARDALLWTTVAIVGTAALGGAMYRLTDADLPYWDAATTVLSLIAQWLVARKVLESWLVWIAADLLCIGIYVVKGLYPTAALYFLLLVMALLGLFTWQRTSAAQPA